MTKEELKSKYPQTYNEIFAEGVAQEKARAIEALEQKKAFDFKLN